MPERAGSYVSENKYLISLYIFRNIFSGLAEKTVSGKSFHFNRLEFLAYDPALSGIRPLLQPRCGLSGHADDALHRGVHTGDDGACVHRAKRRRAHVADRPIHRQHGVINRAVNG